MTVKCVYDDEKDKSYLNTIGLKVPIFVVYIDLNTRLGKKEGRQLMYHYGTTKTPFVELETDTLEHIPFYGENGYALFQLVKYLNDL